MDRTFVVPGFIEETCTRAVSPQTLCVAYVDFDFYEPTLIALQLLHSRLWVGGMVMADDYEVYSTGVKTAVAECLERHSGKYELTLPVLFAGHFCLLSRLAE